MAFIRKKKLQDDEGSKREEVPFDIVEKEVTMSDGSVISFPVKVYNTLDPHRNVQGAAQPTNAWTHE